jgi:hypothetical protein
VELSSSQSYKKNIARWNSTQWQPLGTGMETGIECGVYALTVYNGELIAGGSFKKAGGVQTDSTARWNGTEWHPLGSGYMFEGGVLALTVYNGELIVGGPFTWVYGVTANRLARWDGAQWRPMGSGIGSGSVSTLSDRRRRVWQRGRNGLGKLGPLGVAVGGFRWRHRVSFE